MKSRPRRRFSPPISPARLAIGLVLITAGWFGIWLQARNGMVIGFLLWIVSFNLMAWVTDPASRGLPYRFKPQDIPWLAAIGVLWLVIFTQGKRPHSWLDDAIIHPASLMAGWLVSCCVLAFVRWKRRNNPPWAG
jgi:hypothetical protein